MRFKIQVLFVLGWLVVACQSKSFEKESGQVESFAEMVATGVKPIALVPPMTSAELDLFMPEAERLAEKYGIQLYRESDLLKTHLFPTEASEGKEVLILYQDSIYIQAYQDLKNEIESAKTEELQELSRRFGRLLGYPVWKINELLEANSNFRDLEDFGIQGQELNWYYRDLPKAKAFYQDKLGLTLLNETESEVTFQIAGDSRLVLHDLKSSGYNGAEPKSVALALLSDDLDAWYSHIQKESIPVKYSLKRNPGGPHDGFVAVDTEGYLLEFETFYQHPENERLIPELYQLAEEATSLGEPLSFKGSITWLYYKDMLPAQQFVEEKLGLRLSADQGWAKIYKLSSNSYLGLVDGLRGMNSFSGEKLVDLKISLKNPEGWEEYLKSKGLESELFENALLDSGFYLFKY
ncbi:VOC family protein [Algoriphagus limi]|uniref:VOC family protein n=1 Tax=Algoriphagus limi TaxID=2975273 RepID=A0ABT2G5S7_9BACT|nr:VOC family protein [Algoriphagus limi]MCS5490618.1 VOC family protein [Algoriphagus limi]